MTELARSYHALVRPAIQASIKALDARFAPRLYVYSRTGHLTFIQDAVKPWREVVGDYLGSR